MPRKCPPGVVCFESITLLIIVILCVGIVFYVRSWTAAPSRQGPVVVQGYQSQGLFPRPSYSFSNIQNDVLLNPYSAPLKDSRAGLPINIQTQGVDSSYRQVGILTRAQGPETILPLMGRPIQLRRDKWQYYTMSDKNHSIKLPISVKGRSCTSEYGCDDIVNGDVVYVEGYNDAFKVTVYDSAYPRYIPYL